MHVEGLTCLRADYFTYIYIYIVQYLLYFKTARIRLPLTAALVSRLGHSMWVSWCTKRGLCRFFSGFLRVSPRTNSIPPFLHTHLIHFVSFHFMSLCDGASGAVGRHRCYSLLFNIEASLHLIPRPGPMSDKSWGGKNNVDKNTYHFKLCLKMTVSNKMIIIWCVKII